MGFVQNICFPFPGFNLMDRVNEWIVMDATPTRNFASKCVGIVSDGGDAHIQTCAPSTVNMKLCVSRGLAPFLFQNSTLM